VSTLLAVNGTPIQASPSIAASDAMTEMVGAKRRRCGDDLEPLDLANFLTGLKTEMNAADTVDHDVLRLLKQLTLRTPEWSRHIYFDAESHTRTLVRFS
jgi:hypothetical protein